jgi:hypothetical protein
MWQPLAQNLDSHAKQSCMSGKQTCPCLRCTSEQVRKGISDSERARHHRLDPYVTSFRSTWEDPPMAAALNAMTVTSKYIVRFLAHVVLLRWATAITVAASPGGKLYSMVCMRKKGEALGHIGKQHHFAYLGRTVAPPIS